MVVRALKNFYFTLAEIAQLARMEINPSVTLPFKHRLRAWRGGFLSENYARYNLFENDPDEYLPDWHAHVRALRVNRAHHAWFANKVLFTELVKPFAQVAKTHALVLDGRIVPACPRKPVHKTAELLQLAETTPLVFKPIESCKGKGMFKVRHETADWTINDTPCGEHDLRDRIASLNGYLVSALIEQAAYARAIYPGSTNTVRFLTQIDPATQRPHLAAVAHRFGCADTAPLDSGGFSARVAPETGVLGPLMPMRITGVPKPLSHHPDTQKQVAGTVIPHWESLRDGVLDLAERLSFLPYVGWDVVVTDEGFAVLEGNDFPGIRMHQVHKPLLADRETRRLYRQFRIL